MTSEPAAPNVFRDIARPGVIACAILLVLYFGVMEWMLPFPRDMHRYVLGRDFLNFWIYGREAWSANPARFFNIDAYNQYLQALTGWDYPTQQWSYPPHLLLLAAPFGLLPYLPAYLLWNVLSLGALYLVLANGEGRERKFVMLMLAPAGLFCLISGQNAFLTAAILIAIYRLLDTRPIVAGILLGLLTMKPQLGLLFPLMLILTARWKVFAAASVTALTLAGLSTLLWGPEIWRTYFTLGVPLQQFVITHPAHTTETLMPTIYMNARIAGLSAAAAYTLQGVAALAAVTAVIWTFWRKRDPLLSYALLIVAGFLATPYLMSYDLVIAGWLIIMLWQNRALAPHERALFMALYLLPFIAMALALLSVPGSALVLVGVALWLLVSLKKPIESELSGLQGGKAIPI